MAAPTDTATPPANMPAVPPGQGQATGAAPDPMKQYEMLGQRAQRLATLMGAPILKMDADQAEFIRQYEELGSTTNQQIQDKQDSAAKKQGMFGLIGSLFGAALGAATLFFTRKKEKWLVKWGVPIGGTALGGILGGIAGNAMGSKAQKQLSGDQQAIVTANNEAVEKLCDTFEQKLAMRVQQLAASGMLQGGLDISGQASAPVPQGTDRAISADDLRQLSGQGMPGQPPFASSPMNTGSMASGQMYGGDGASMPVVMPASPMAAGNAMSGYQVRGGDGASMPMVAQGTQAMPKTNMSDVDAQPAFPRVGVGAPS